MTNFKLQRVFKVFFIASAIVFLAAACSKPAVNQNQPSDNNQQSPTPTGQTQTKDNASGPDYFPDGQRPGGVPQAPTIAVTQTVEGSNLNQSSYQVVDGEKAIDLLKTSHKVQTKEYSGIGEFVQAIDSNAADSKHFWEFFVNGKSSNVGASSYALRDGDKIEWKLSVISSSGE